MNLRPKESILFIHEVDWIQKVVYEIHDIPELLSLRGYEVSVLDFPEASGRHWRKSVRPNQSRAWPGSKIRLVSPPMPSASIFGRWLIAALAIPFMIRLVLQLRPNVIVTYAVPTYGWQAVTVGRLLRIPVIYRAIDAPTELRPGLHRPLTALAERYVCRFSTHVSSHNDVLRNRCVSHGASSKNTSLLIPGVDQSRFHHGPRNAALAEELGIHEDDVVILFMGTLFNFAQLDDFVELIAPHLRANQALKFLLVGDGEAAPLVSAVIQKEQLHDSVIMVGIIEFEKLPDYLRLGSVGILPFTPSAVSHNALPNKVLQYLSCGLPSIAIQLDGLKSVIPEFCGLEYVADLHELSERVVSICQDSARLTKLRDDALRYSQLHLDWDSQILKFEQLLEDVVSQFKL